MEAPPPEERFRRVRDQLLDLTAMLEQGNIAALKNASEVVFSADAISKTAPAGWTPPRSFSGFFTVDESTDSRLFAWVFEPEDLPADAPTLLWLQGGPGADDEFGMFSEIGPMQVVIDSDGVARITPRDDSLSWCTQRRCIFLDQPVFAGYSTAASLDDIPLTLVESSKHVVTALEQIFTVWPAMQETDFFIAAESYGGKYGPGLATAILNRAPSSVKIPLRGLAVGDGWVHPPVHFQVYASEMTGMGLLSPEENLQVASIMAKADALRAAGKTIEAFQQWDSVWGDCGGACGFPYPSLFENMTGSVDTLNFARTSFPPEISYYNQFLARDVAKEALHVGDIPMGKYSGAIYQKLAVGGGDFMNSTLPDCEYLLSKGINLMFYNGNLDPILGAQHGFGVSNALNWTGTHDYATNVKRVLTIPAKDGTPSASSPAIGYIKEARSNGAWFAQVIVRNAGHLAPHDQPESMRFIIDSFISGSFPAAAA